MKFHISRVSCFDDETSPCEKAYKDKYVRVDERTVNDPMKNNFIGKVWYDEGTNHRVEKGHIKRDFQETGWFIDINSFEELLQLLRREGDLILSESYFLGDGKTGHIKIYDDYVE
jgi:hypothetical protein